MALIDKNKNHFQFPNHKLRKFQSISIETIILNFILQVVKGNTCNSNLVEVVQMLGAVDPYNDAITQLEVRVQQLPQNSHQI